MNAACGRSAACLPLRQPLQQAARQLDEVLRLTGPQLPSPGPLQAAELRAALSRVLALAHFHPAAHPVHETGKKLARVWRPLLANSGNDIRGKLLVYALRLQQQLQAPLQAALRQGMQRELQAELASLHSASPAAQQARLARIVGQLALLHDFWRAGAAASGTAAAKGGWADPPPVLPRHGNLLEAALRWQYWLEAAALTASDAGQTLAAALLQPYMQQQLDQIALRCARSDGTLAYYCSSGLAGLWQRTLQLALFCQAGPDAARLTGLDAARFTEADAARLSEPDAARLSEPDAARLTELEAVCLRQHLRSTATTDDRHQLLRQILLLAQHTAVTASAAEPEPAGRAHALAAWPATELARYREHLAACLTARANATPAVSDALLTLTYKLAWIFDGCHHRSLALLCNTAYQVCRQFRFVRRPLPGSVLQVLAALPALLEPHTCAAASAGTLRALRWQLLRQWPEAADIHLPIALHTTDASGQGLQEVPLAAVPLLLSGSFAALVQVARQPLTLPVSAARHAALRQELLLLEQGAAAMKVWPLEQLCTLLLEVHARLPTATLATTVPARLLEAAHASLVRLLDQAAAWQEPVADAGVNQALQAWLDQQADTAQWTSVMAVREGSKAATSGEQGDARARLHASLHAFTRSLAAMVEKPVRLTVDADQALLDAAALPVVEAALKPLLKFILLDTAAGAHRRREAHKPLVSALDIQLRRHQQQLLVTVLDDAGSLLPAPAQLRQLQRRLPASAGTLDCEVRRGRGRSFSLALQLDRSAQAGDSAWRC